MLDAIAAAKIAELEAELAEAQALIALLQDQLDDAEGLLEVIRGQLAIRASDPTYVPDMGTTRPKLGT